MKEKSQLHFSVPAGLDKNTVKAISARKQEPEWVKKKRLEALSEYEKMPLPAWGPDLSELNLDNIVYYAEAGSGEARTWDKVPAEIRQTFERLGIPEGEREALAGAGAQYESLMAYHNLKKEWGKLGVIFESFDQAVKKYPGIVQQYFMNYCVPPAAHKFAAMHGAVFSGGTFIYVPPGVEVTMPLQAYFRMNAPGLGQFEHTLIIADEGSSLHYIEGCSAPRYEEANLHAGCVEIFVKKNARVRYTSVENWSKNVYNLNTKRAVVEENGMMEWVGANLGSKTTMLYPASILKGKGAKTKITGVSLAGEGQDLDTGAKAVHLAPSTASTITSKSIVKRNGRTSFRGQIKIQEGAEEANAKMRCDSLLLDKTASSHALPSLAIEEKKARAAHEATAGPLEQKQLLYLRSRGFSEEEAVQMIIAAFVEPVSQKLPLEYAVEFNRLIELELEGGTG